MGKVSIVQNHLEMNRSALNVLLNLTMDFDLIHCRGYFTSVSEMHGKGELGDLSFPVDLCVYQPVVRVLFPFPFYLLFRPVSNWDTHQQMGGRFFCLKVSKPWKSHLPHAC